MKNLLKYALFIMAAFQFSAFANTTISQDGWQDLHGQQVQASLEDAYSNTATKCGVNSPAFNCSGILLRGTDHSSSYFSWNPSPASVTSGGVSFSYLRTDSKYSNLAYSYSNGFIIYPDDNKPNDKITLDVLCSFPIDAATNNRSDAGCGGYNDQSVGIQCQLQGITTADEWYDHYVKYDSSHTKQCGFGLTSDYDNIADAFYQTIKSMSLISTESFNDQNELRIATWSQDIPKELPIQAFFYTNSAGKADAQADQQDFYNQTGGMFVPIIKLVLPTTTEEEATFTYNADAQSETDTLSVKNIIAYPAEIYTSGEQTSTRLLAKVTSSNGQPIKGAMVTWVKTSDTATLGNTITYTNAEGIATTTFTDTAAENAIVLAYGPDGVQHNEVVVPVKAEQQDDYVIDTLKTDKTEIKADGSDTATISVTLSSASGASLSDVNVNWTTTAGSLSATTTQSDAQGTATVSLTGSAAGEAVITATLENGNTQSTWVDITE